MSTKRFFLAARGFALTLLGAGTLAVADAGCGVSVTALCQRVCDCTGCNATQRQTCDSGFNDAQKLSGDKGCSDAYNTYLSCVDAHLQCVGNAVDLTACATESAALEKCTGGSTVVGGGPTQVSCDQTSNGGNTHLCVVYENASSVVTKSLGDQCVKSGGTVGQACGSAGALGVCKLASGGITLLETFYSAGGLTVGQATMACSSSGGTWSAG